MGALASEWRRPVRLPVSLTLIVFGGLVLANGSGVTARILSRVLPGSWIITASALMVGSAFTLVILAVRSAPSQNPLPGALARSVGGLFPQPIPVTLPDAGAPARGFPKPLRMGINPPTPRAFLLILALLPILYVWAYGLSLFTERQTPRVRQGLMGLLPGPSTRSTAPSAG